VPYEVIGGGNPCPVIALLTGHQADHVLDKDLTDQKLHELLTRLTRKRRLICCGMEKGKALPPGVGGGHIYAIFGYDSGRRQVKVFNPWGNTFTPAGDPGPANGYPTLHGVFVVPLAEFRKVFKAVRYETANPGRE
jgi:hypothetical protein